MSLLPSATEILFAIGAGDDLAGVTIDCDYPPAARHRRVVSTTTIPAGLTPREIDEHVRQRLAAGEELYQLDEFVLRELDPDLLLTQDLCAVCAVAVSTVDEAMAHLGCSARVVTLDPQTLDQVLDSIGTIGAATDRRQGAAELTASLRQRLSSVATAVAGRSWPRVAVIEWTEPPFTGGHWVPDLVTAAGGMPTLGRSGRPSVATTWQEIEAAQPDVLIISPCGYRLDRAVSLTHEALATGLLPPDVPVWAIDADAVVVRPGPRLVDGVEAIAGLLHPDVLPQRPDLVTLVRP